MVIRISDETKAKIRVKASKVKRWFSNNGPYIFAGATTIAAWKGYRTSKRNSRRINTLMQRTDVLKDAINSNAVAQAADREIIEKMFNDNKKLFNESLHIVVPQGKAK